MSLWHFNGVKVLGMAICSNNLVDTHRKFGKHFETERYEKEKDK